MKTGIRAFAFLLLSISAVACASAQATPSSLTSGTQPYEMPQYLAIQHKLAQNWGTWNTNNVLEQVLLPVGAEVNVAFKQATWISDDYLHTALIGQSGDNAPYVRPGLHALDGSYATLTIHWEDLDARISMATVPDSGKTGANDMVMLVEPLHAPKLPVEALIEAGILWNRPGSTTREQDTLLIHTPTQTVRVYTTGHVVVDPYAQSRGPYLAVPLNQPIGISTGTPRTVAQIRAILAVRRAQLIARSQPYKQLGSTYLAMEAVLGWNTIYEPRYSRVITTVGRLWNQGYGGYCLFGWDNFFLSYLTSLYSRDLGYANFIAHLHSMTYEGFIPNGDRGNGTKSWDHSQPPVGSLMLLQIYKLYPERWLLRASFPDLLRWNRWWFKARMNDGLLSYGSNLAKNPYDAPDTHTIVTAGYESGMDDSPMYAGVPFNAKKNTLALQDVGLNSLYIADCKALISIAHLLGYKQAAAELSAREQLIAKHMQSLWDPSVGLYLNRRTDTGKFSMALSPTMFYPLLAGLPSKQRAQEMIDHHLLNPKEFYGPYMIPSISRNNPAFPHQSYWKGAVWPPLNFLVYLGLRDYGFDKVSGELAQKSDAMLLNNWQRLGMINENYSAITGTGNDPRLSSDPFHSWGALMGLMSFIQDGYLPGPAAPLPAPASTLASMSASASKLTSAMHSRP